jgi:pyruvate dehydrogenase E2 component (dihydrolipoamide acetyltransferase)
MALVQEIPVPLLAVNDTTLTVVETTLAGGSAVKKGDLILVFETSKTTYEVEAPSDGYIQYCCEAGRDYEVNEVVARVYSEAAEALRAPILPQPRVASEPAATVKPAITMASQAAEARNGHPAEPSVLPYWEGETIFSREADRLIAAAGLDKSLFKGRDFVAGADVERILRPAASVAIPVGGAVRPAAPKAAALVDPAKAILERLSSGKKREIDYLSDVQAPGLTSTVNSFVEVEGIFTHINPALRYLKDSLLPVILYEVSRLLADYPVLNGWFNGDGVAIYHDINPGFAIDIDKGLKVVKLAKAGEKSIGQIEGDILHLSGKYLDDTLQLEDLTDISFTITDLSAEGVAFFRPLINKMNSAILGVSAIDPRLQRCTLSLSFDHRVTEGKLAARFLHELKGRLESYRPADYAPHKDVSCFKCYKTLREDLGGAGFVRCITPAGKDGFICQTCLKGF